MQIRREEERDYNVIYDLVMDAFKSATHSDGREQNLVGLIRQSKEYIPELSLVAEIDGKIVGFIMFSKAYLGTKTVLALAPLGVLPEFQGQGIGSRLVEEGHKIGRDLGYDYSIVLGDDRYYSKFAYRPSEEFGIYSPFDVPREYFMACKLRANPSPVKGVVKYSPAFGID